jgi:hypothetical protein
MADLGRPRPLTIVDGGHFVGAGRAGVRALVAAFSTTRIKHRDSRSR